MIEVELPDTEGVPELVRSFAACLASVTETPVTDVAQMPIFMEPSPTGVAGWLAAVPGWFPLPTQPGSTGPATGSPSLETQAPWASPTARRRC